MLETTNLDLFAGIPVEEFAAARIWYERLLGCPPVFFPHETEAVWELAAHRYVYIVQQPRHAGHARVTLLVEGLDSLVADIRARGLKARYNETYGNGVRKVTYRDPDGNELGFGAAPNDRSSTPGPATRSRRVGRRALNSRRRPRSRRPRARRRSSG